MLSAYFLKRNFAHKKIGTLSDFKEKEKITSDNLKNFDFVVLPQNFMEKFDNEVFDLIINTTSLGEMTDEMQDYYLENIERVSKNYFYSVNRSKKERKSIILEVFMILISKKGGFQKSISIRTLII